MAWNVFRSFVGAVCCMEMAVKFSLAFSPRQRRLRVALLSSPETCGELARSAVHVACGLTLRASGT